MNGKEQDKLRTELIWALTRQGAFQRSRIYKEKTDEKLKKEFRDEIKNFLRNEIYLKFKNKSISENQLIDKIESLIRHLEKNFGRVLCNNAFQFGNAQKFINLYLKYMWIIGEINEPPHFPVDRIIQKELKTEVYNWTNMSKTQYLEVINRAKFHIQDIVEFESIAEWEALVYLENYIEK